MGIEGGKFIVGNRQGRRTTNRLGRIAVSSDDTGTFRNPKLEIIDKYIQGSQYDHLSDWNAKNACGDPLPIKSRKPIIIYNLAKRISRGVSSKLLGPRVFPEISLDEDPLTKELIDHLITITSFKSIALDASKFLVTHGSTFMRMKILNGVLKVEKYNPNICYPEFDDVGQLEKVMIKKVFSDLKDLDENGDPKLKWFRMDLEKNSDILYDSPEFTSGGEDPEFQIIKRIKHDVGFVQGEWIKVGDDVKSPDGEGLICDVTGFIDAFNYSVSQSDQAVRYNQEPQLMIKGMDNDEIDDLVKSSMNAWTLGREGDASYLETNLGGVETASKLRDEYKQNIGDITRVVLQDPEKIVGSAQSAKAMEVLHGPLLDLIDELRPYAEKGIIAFLQKMTALVLIMNQRGVPLVGINIPAGFQPESLGFTLNWPAVFPMTMADLQQKVSVGVSASGGNVISRKSITKWLAKDFNIEDIDAEIAEISSQPVLNPFGF